jgi:hypothetical protein
MRLSVFAVVVVLSMSTAIFAQHSAGSSAGASHSSYSGSSSSSASSHISSGSTSHVSRTSAPSRPSSPSRDNAAPEKKGLFSSLRHPFKKATPVQSVRYKPTVPCFKEPCAICPSGGSRNGACRVVNTGCRSGQAWNGFGCGAQYWSNDCTALAHQLAAMRRQMHGQNDIDSLHYRLLQDQYQQCERRFGSYAFSNAFLFDIP